MVRPSAASALLWAAESIPRAMPDTMVIPRKASPLDSMEATRRPREVGFLDPTTEVEGRIESLNELNNWHQLIIEEGAIDLREPYSGEIKIGEVLLPGNSRFVGSTLNSLGFRARFGVNVLALRRNGQVKRTRLADEPFQRGDALLVAGPSERRESSRANSVTRFGFAIGVASSPFTTMALSRFAPITAPSPPRPA